MPKIGTSGITTPVSTPESPLEANERLALRRNALFSQFTSLHDQAKASTAHAVITAYFQAMLTLLATFQQYQLEIRSNNEQLENRDQTNCDAVEKSITAILQATAELQEKHKTPIAPPTPVTPAQSSSHIHLPPMDITPFDGNLDHWSEFISSFNTFVHLNLTLTPLLKFHYLKTLLKKVPLSLITHLPTSEENYDVAYDIMTSYFNDPRRTFAHHLHKLTQSSTSNLKELLSRFNSAFSELKLSSIEDKFDYLLLALSLNGLDKETRKAFEVGLKGSDVPTTSNLLDFIRERVRIQDISSSNMATPSQGQAKLPSSPSKSPSKPVFFTTLTSAKSRPLQQSSSSHSPPRTSYSDVISNRNSHQMTTPPSPTSPSHHSYSNVYPSRNSQQASRPRSPLAQNLRCPICQEAHRTYQCPSFASATLQERLNWLRSHNRCTNCLGAHESSRCRSHYRCLHCSQSHHTTLHDLFPSSHPHSGRNTQRLRSISPPPLDRFPRQASLSSLPGDRSFKPSPAPLNTRSQPLVHFEKTQTDRSAHSPPPLLSKPPLGFSESRGPSPIPSSSQN